MPFRYTCVSCPNLRELRYIDEYEIEITYRTFIKYVDREWLREWEQVMGYGRTLRLKKDWSVTYGRSRLPDGRRVYILYWSAIHHVFYHDAKED